MALPTDPDQRLALGKRLHERPSNITVSQAAEQMGLREHHCYPLMKEYRDSVGIVTPAQVRIAALRAEGRGPEQSGRRRTKANGGNGHAPTRQLVKTPTVADYNVKMADVRIAELEAENAELREQLRHAMEEIGIHQKILMEVGRAL